MRKNLLNVLFIFSFIFVSACGGGGGGGGGNPPPKVYFEVTLIDGSTTEEIKKLVESGLIVKGKQEDSNGTDMGLDNSVWCTEPNGRGEIIVNRAGMTLYPVEMITITDREGLENIIDDVISTPYILANDIDLSAEDWKCKSHTGVILHGAGHEISNMKLQMNGLNAGLFCEFNGGYVRDLNIDANTSITTAGNNYIGAVAGRMQSGTLENILVSGTIKTTDTSTGNIHIGGLAGQALSSTIKKSKSTAVISGISTGGAVFAGGIAGVNNVGTIQTSYATGAVTAATTTTTTSDAYAGGIAGSSEGIIQTSYATGAVSARAEEATAYAYAGGIVGQNHSVIQTSYATGTVTAATTSDAYAGGIAGQSRNTIKTSYATGAVSATAASDAYAGGIVGHSNNTVLYCAAINTNVSATAGTAYIGKLIGDSSAGVANNNLVNEEMILTSTATVTDTDTNGTLTPFADFKLKATYTTGMGAGAWDFVDIWTIEEGIDYPTLR